jgi:hypothetical protein
VPPPTTSSAATHHPVNLSQPHTVWSAPPTHHDTTGLFLFGLFVCFFFGFTHLGFGSNILPPFQSFIFLNFIFGSFKY